MHFVTSSENVLLTPTLPTHRHVRHGKQKRRESPFASFWMGGFESACQINTKGQRIDMVALTQHDILAQHDYEMMKRAGIGVARDGLRWPCIDRGSGPLDFSTFIPMVRAARRAGVQIIWNLLHYGWPLEIDILSARFIERFATLCREVAKIVCDESDGARLPVFVPVNEISFLSWAMGTKGIIQPVMLGHGWEIKKQLVRAAIAGMEAIWEIEPRARFAHVDPLIHVVPPRDRPGLAEAARAQREAQFQSWDLLCGRLEPEVGGAMKYLDLLGINYYHSNQFEHPDVRLRWEDHPRDDRFVPFHRLLDEVHHRYGRPLFIAETSHFGVGRGAWLREIAAEIYIARMQGVPVEGVCLYPIIDRPDWEDANHWHNSGLWDLQKKPSDSGEILERVANEDYMAAFAWAKELMADTGA